MIKISAFSDEISQDLTSQLAVLQREGIQYLDLRTVACKNVAALTTQEAQGIRDQLAQHGFKVSSLASPIGKIRAADNFKPHFEKFIRCLELAEIFETEYVRVFSYFVTGKDERAKAKKTVLERLSRQAAYAEETDVTLLLENDVGLYGDTGEHCLEILEAVNSPSLRVAFDPVNFVRAGEHPFEDAWKLLKNYAEHIQIRDISQTTGQLTYPGTGDAALDTIITDAFASGFDGYLSLEPQMSMSPSAGDATRQERFALAVAAFRNVCKRSGAENIPQAG